jgi:hypothetical protein
MAKQGYCAKCGRMLSVRKDGLMYPHEDNDGKRCKGSLKAPVGPVYT